MTWRKIPISEGGEEQRKGEREREKRERERKKEKEGRLCQQREKEERMRDRIVVGSTVCCRLIHVRSVASWVASSYVDVS